MIIHDADLVREFADMFTFELSDNDDHVTMVFMANRRKYDDELKKNEKNCHMKVISQSGVEHFVKLVKTYEQYQAKGTVLYCLINPRSLFKAQSMATRTVVNDLLSTFNAVKSGKWNGNSKTVHSRIMSSLQKSPANHLYCELDIDTKEKPILDMIRRECIPMICIDCVIETKNGYHIVFETLPDKETKYLEDLFKEDRYMFLHQHRDGSERTGYYVEVRKDPSPPIPGTVQGGWNVVFSDIFT